MSLYILDVKLLDLLQDDSDVIIDMIADDYAIDKRILENVIETVAR